MRIRRLAALLSVLPLTAGVGAGLLPGTAGASTAPAVVRAGIKPLHPGVRPATSTIPPLTLQTSHAKGAVSPHPKVYLVFWGSQWSANSAASTYLAKFFANLHGSADTYDPILAQYCEGLAVGTVNCGSAGTHVVTPTTSSLGGVWIDTRAAAPAAASGAQLAAEALAAAKHFRNTTQTPNLQAQYVVASPSGTNPDNYQSNGFCGYHSTATTSVGKIAWTNLPYLPDLGVGGCTTIANPTIYDGWLSTETHEYSETVTDFFVGTGWLDNSGQEIGDKCTQLDGRITLAGTAFDVQGEWSNVRSTCVTTP